MKAILSFKSTKENIEYTAKDIYATISSVNAKTIKSLEKTLKVLECKMAEIVKSHTVLNQQFKLIRSVPGVGPQTAMYLIIATKGFKSFDSARKLACYSGIAPFEYGSGTSVRARTKVNHMADKKMKTLLQMCALSAVRHDSQLKEYYNKKKEQGKNNMLILNNVRCKIIGRVFSVINRQTPFVNTYKFAK